MQPIQAFIRLEEKLAVHKTTDNVNEAPGADISANARTSIIWL